MNNILVFKTNINSTELIQKVNNVLAEQSEIKKWNIDLEDCDKILRVETTKSEIESILGILKPYEIYCEELE